MSVSSPRPVRIALEGVDGVGKSSVVRRIRDELVAEASVLYETMAPVTLDLLKSFGREVHGDPQEYWTRVSRRTKTQVFLTEGVVRAEYLAGYYAGFDAVVYDRWWQTFAAYTDVEVDFDGRCRFLRDALPELDVVVYLRGDTDVCAARLIADDDWLTGQMPVEEVAAFLAGLQRRYDGLLMDDPRCVVVETGRRSVDDVAAEVVGAVRAALSERPVTGARSAGAYSPKRTQFATPQAEALYAVEGIDGSGKTTLARSVAASCDDIDGASRLASASLMLFKRGADAAAGEDPSAAIRRVFEDEFRQQTYLVDGLVQLACLADDARPSAVRRVHLFDRWFPLFGLFHHQIESDRELFDYLRSRFPLPHIVFYLAIEPPKAVERLSDRDDWMLTSLGADGSARALQGMIDEHRRQLPDLRHASTYSTRPTPRPS